MDPGSSDQERVGSTGGRTGQVLGMTVLGRGTGAGVLGTDEASIDPGDSCDRLGLHSGGDR